MGEAPAVADPVRRYTIQDDAAVREGEMRALTNMMAADGRRIDALAGEVGQVKGTVSGMDSKLDDVRDGIAELTRAMASVVRLEVRHEQQASEVDDLRNRHDKLTGRVEAIEHQMPQLIETRAWVTRAVTGIAALVGVAVVGLVLTRGGA